MKRTFSTFLVAIFVCLMTAMMATAQLNAPRAPETPAAASNAAANAPVQATRVPPPTPPATDPIGMTIALYYGVIVLLGGAAIAVSIMPGKRGHQD